MLTSIKYAYKYTLTKLSIEPHEKGLTSLRVLVFGNGASRVARESGSC
jgi:hypothetical protein